MKTKILKQMVFGACALMTIAACKPNLDEYTPPSAGTGNGELFKKYISVGNSLTAGYADGGLYNDAMQYAYPKLIAKQMEEVGGGTFVIPSFNAGEEYGSGKILSLIGFDALGNPNITTTYNGIGNGNAVKAITYIPSYNVTLTAMTAHNFSENGLNNFGVPGIKLTTSFLPGYGGLNGFYMRLLETSEISSTSYLNFVLNKANKNKNGEEDKYTFFSCWLGNNDALGWATSGGDGVGNPETSIASGGDAFDPLTSQATFAGMYSAAIKSLTQNGTIKGVVATIPDVTSIPFFNAVPAAKVIASAKATAEGLGLTFAGVFIKTSAGVRTLTNEDLIPLSSKDVSYSAALAQYSMGLNPALPMPDSWVLDKDEIATVKSYVASYNSSIKTIASQYNLAIFDANDFMAQMKTSGKYFNGVKVTADFIGGGAFSLDGVHLTARGNAIVANEFIKAINTKYGSSISLLNVASYNGVKMP